MINSDTLIVVPDLEDIKDYEEHNYKKINSINYYQRGSELLELLREVGAVTFNENNILVISSFFKNIIDGNAKGGHVSRLLGYVTEGIIVRDCNNDLSRNRKWANYARKLKETPKSLDLNLDSIWRFITSVVYESLSENPDSYIAVGTGFSSTKNGEKSWIYNHISDRDICWIHKNNDGRQLLTVDDLQKVNQRFAGLQVKVSCANTGSYVTNYFKSKPYYGLYPVVYFDLGNDFHKTRDRIYYLSSDDVKPQTIFSNDVDFEGYTRPSRDKIIEMMLVRGKDIAPDLHEELLWHKYTLSQILSGRINLDELANEKVLTGLITEYVGNSLENPSPIIIASN
jgi:hypothetical protein